MMHYTWNGEPIIDIRAWCRERNEDMVVCLRTKKEVDPYTARIITTVDTIELPASFYDNIRMSVEDGRYSEIRRYRP